jgi:nicotinamide-nucleotide amidase
MAKASIITIGDELLIGQVTDTNSTWIASELNKAGIRVIRRVAVGDDANEIRRALDQESSLADVILMTGGLGPTADDITKPLLCEYFSGKMVQNAEVLAHIRHLFEVIYKRPLAERNIRQADVPDTCNVIMNTRGTAPGMLFRRNGKIFISMPGVPFEMQGLMESAIPILKKELSLVKIMHRTLTTAGVGESVLADLLMDFESQLPSFIKLAYLPRYGMVRLRLTATGNEPDYEQELNKKFSSLLGLVSDHLVTDRDEPIEATLGRLLREKKKTLCTAESCTGGYISHLITSQPGASEYYEGSFITYSYNAKELLLHVDEKTLNEKGAVSEEVVLQMASGALDKIKADYVVAVSGILGPGGGTPEKPVGTVWMAFGSRRKLETRKFTFRWDRRRNAEMTAIQAMDNLRRFILAEA